MTNAHSENTCRQLITNSSHDVDTCHSEYTDHDVDTCHSAHTDHNVDMCHSAHTDHDVDTFHSAHTDHDDDMSHSAHTSHHHDINYIAPYPKATQNSCLELEDQFLPEDLHLNDCPNDNMNNISSACDLVECKANMKPIARQYESDGSKMVKHCFDPSADAEDIKSTFLQDLSALTSALSEHSTAALSSVTHGGAPPINGLNLETSRISAGDEALRMRSAALGDDLQPDEYGLDGEGGQCSAADDAAHDSCSISSEASVASVGGELQATTFN